VAAKTRVQRCLCKEVDGIWQYYTGGNLTIFDKDHDTAEEGRSQARQKQSSLKKKLISLWYAGSLNRHQLYIVIEAKPSACTQVLVAGGNQIKATYLELAWLTEVSILIQNHVLKSLICL